MSEKVYLEGRLNLAAPPTDVGKALIAQQLAPTVQLYLERARLDPAGEREFFWVLAGTFGGFVHAALGTENTRALFEHIRAAIESIEAESQTGATH